MKKILFAIFIISGCFLHKEINAAFYEEINIGAKAQSMAGAFETETSDVSGVFYNPASLTGIRNIQLFTTYENLYAGLADDSSLKRYALSAGVPVKLSGREIGVSGLSYYKFSLDSLYSESVLGLAHGYPLKDNFFIGLQFKILNVSYGKTKYTVINDIFDGGYSKSAITQDLGMLYMFDKAAIGLSVLNVTQPDLGLKYENKVKRNIRAGVRFEGNRLKLNASVTQFTGSIRIRTGVETWFFNRKLFLRGGLNLGSWDYRNVSLGFGYAGKKYEINYSFKYPLSGITDIIGTHQISLNYSFGDRKEKEEKEQEENKDLKPIPAYIVEEEVPSWEKSWAYDLIEKAKKLIEEGEYKQARDKYKEAYKIIPKNNVVKKQVAKLNNVNIFYKVVKKADDDNKEQAKKKYLLKNGIAGYINGRPHIALNNIIYASQLWPKDENISKFLTVLSDEFPDISSQKKLLVGTNWVEQLLEKSLEMIYAGRYSESVSTCEEALTLEPNNIIALTRMGSAYWAMGRKEKAYKVWKRVIELEPDNKAVKEQLKKYEKENNIKE